MSAVTESSAPQAPEAGAGSGVSGTGAGRASRRRRGRRTWSPTLTLLMGLMLLYCLLPLYWLVVSATKTNDGLFTSNGLWFGSRFALWENVVQTFQYQDGVYLRWLGNTVMYAVVGAGGATIIATLGGYGLAKYDFPGKRAVQAVVFGAITVPLTALAVPTFLLFSRLGLVNTPWSVLIPALVSPFGLFLMRVFAADGVPDTLIEAARVDGASEWRIFRSISLRLLGPGFVTVLLFTLVATWNNYFLPLIMLSDPKWYPLTVGLNQWNSQVGSSSVGQPVYNIVITGSLLAIVPLIASFLLLQRYWQSGLAAGSVKG